ncbi:MAG TPA: hypothetical protein VLX61_11520 [Anaerolineales bacterium]|nr:hypothetical protein [Anaerolineales bacterium]
MRKKKETILTPFTRWLLEYSDQHDTTLTELSIRAGLSAGTLRTYVTHPDRQRPTVETCIRISRITERPLPEILELAGLEPSLAPGSFNPNRTKLLEIFDSLPPSRQSTVLRMLDALDEEER